MRTTITLLLATLVLGCSTACGRGEPQLDPATVVVTVTRAAPSTQEQAGNDRSLTLSEDGIVHQQGDGAPTTEPMDEQTWDDFVADLPEELEEIDDEDASCTGAGGTLLSVEGAGEENRRVAAMVCGGESPPAAEQIEALVADFR